MDHGTVPSHGFGVPELPWTFTVRMYLPVTYLRYTVANQSLKDWTNGIITVVLEAVPNIF
jgi:hypothetical protein